MVVNRAEVPNANHCRKGYRMTCESCKAIMREEDVVVSGGTIKTKGITAWHCLNCGRIEYRRTVTQRLILEDIESSSHAA